MRVAIVENTRFTHHGQIGVALHEAGAMIDLYRPWADGLLPEPASFDALVVFGGEQNALADTTHPYLPALGALMQAAALSASLTAKPRVVSISRSTPRWESSSSTTSTRRRSPA